MTCIYWRDIPAQVIVRVGRTKHKQVLDPRFAKAIDRAAMRAGRGSSNAYLEDWRRVSEPVSGDIQQIITDKIASFEAQFNPVYLEKVVKAGGLTAAVTSDQKSTEQ